MRLTSIAVIGGGPGGLYAARLLKLEHPHAQVDLYEQGVPDKTFGFGVGLAARTQRHLHDADSASFQAIADASYPHEMSMQVDGRVAQLPHGNLRAIARSTLLRVLQASAGQAGVRLHFGARCDVRAIDADLMVAADGAGSGTRETFAAEFQREIATGAGLYLWSGTEFALPTALFTPVTTEHGTFVAHAYPYAPDRSRRPAVAHLQEAADRSRMWWESFPERTHLPVAQLMLAYLTRAGKVDIEQVARNAPALARRSLADFAGVEARAVPESDLTEWILGQPVTHEGVTHARRTAHDERRDAATTETLDIDYESAWGPQADALVGAPPDANTLWLTGSPDRAALLVRLDLAERLRRATRSLIVVEGSGRDIGDLAAGLASERTHLVAVTPEVPA